MRWPVAESVSVSLIMSAAAEPVFLIRTVTVRSPFAAAEAAEADSVAAGSEFNSRKLASSAAHQ